MEESVILIMICVLSLGLIVGITLGSIVRDLHKINAHIVEMNERLCQLEDEREGANV